VPAAPPRHRAARKNGPVVSRLPDPAPADGSTVVATAGSGGAAVRHAEDAEARRSAATAPSRNAARSPLDAEPRRSPRPNRDRDEPPTPTDPRQIALSMLVGYGWDSTQFACLDDLWVGESNWDHRATNPTSGAYGIPQALPPGKMARAGDDWRTNPATQIEWGRWYISMSYGTPCAANEFKLANNWY